MRREGTHTSFKSIILAGAASLALAAGAQAQSGGEVVYDIPAQDLAGALNAYAVQSDKDILFSPDAVDTRRTGGLQGRYAPDQALAMLLDGSGLAVQQTNGAILIGAPAALQAARGGTGAQEAAPVPQPNAAVPQSRETRPAPVVEAAVGEDDDEEVDEIVVVGSQIQGSSVTDTLPVTVIGPEDIAAVAATSGDELFRAIPQVGDIGFNEESTTVGGVNSARGDVASINLRSIGTGNTLVLLNGRRMVLHPGVQVENLVPVTTVNTNAIPVMGVDRVEVLRDGAAAVYGSDAVAGVINVILKDDLEGVTAEAQYGVSEGTGLEQFDLSLEAGKSFNAGATNLSLFANYTDRSPMLASDRDYSRSTDLRPLVEGTDFEGDSNFDNRTANTPWGYFDPLDFSDPIISNGVQISDDDGDIHISPDGFADCAADSGAVCVAPGRVPDALNYNENSERYISGAVERLNLFGFLNHEFGAGVEFFAEGGYYWADYNSVREQGAALSSAPITVPSYNYYNPLGPVTFEDGRVNPNRLPGLNIPAEGLNLDLDLYRLIDAGPRRINVENTSYRLLGGFRGEVSGWDWESALLYSEAKADDTTSNRVSSTLFQQALMRDTPDAYNPFNGGDPANLSTGDATPSEQATIDSFLIDVSRVATTSIRIADLRISRPDLFTIPGGDVGVALGVEQRRETYEDDRDDRLDGAVTFTNPFTGEVSDSDVLGSSGTQDSEGERDVWAAYAELAVPLVSEDMNIPLAESVEVQFAGRFESYDSFGEVAKPKVAASWRPVSWLQFRGSWSEGFRAPNLPQLFETGGERVNTRDDYIFCEADLRAGRISNFDACDRAQSVVSNRSGSRDLEPEETENVSVGAVFTPDFIPAEYGSFTFTVDYWKIEQEGVVGIFGDENQIALDYLLRVNGSSNPDVVRADPTAEDIAAFAGTGIDPVGEIISVDDGYKNLLPREIEGLDFVAYYTLDDTRWGDFDFNVNVARLLNFDQAPSPEAELLLAAQEDGTISDVFPIVGVNSLLRQDGLPKWRGTASASWRSGPWGAGLFASYVGSVFDTSATLSDGTLWKVDDWLTASLYGQYEFQQENGPWAGTRVRVGVRNFTDEKPPLADSDYGYIGDLHSNRGRYIYGSIRKSF